MSIDNTDKEIKKTRNRPSKKERYVEERNKILEDIWKLMRMNEENSIFLYELERNEEAKEYIRKNEEEIKKYWKCGGYGYFSNDIKKGKNNEIGLIRAIYGDNDYNIMSKLKVNKFNDVKKQYTQLVFNKKN